MFLSQELIEDMTQVIDGINKTLNSDMDDLSDEAYNQLLKTKAEMMELIRLNQLAGLKPSQQLK